MLVFDRAAPYAPGAPGGYSGHRTGSVVAGLTAALWDLDSAKVEGGGSVEPTHLQKEYI